MKIIKNKEPQLIKPSFNVDNELDSKLNQFPLTSLMNRSNFTLFQGKPGSGKSSLFISFLQSPSLFKKVYHHIFIFIPQNSRSSVTNNFFDNNIPESNMFDEVTLENLQDSYNQSLVNSLEKETTLYIFDDVQSYFKNPEIEKMMLHIINNRRHARISIWIACQNYKSIPPKIRMNLSDMFIFKIGKAEMENIFEEAIEQHKKAFLTVTNFVYDKPHNFLYINTNSQRLFKNWDEILL